jgi:hypothetical protein
VQLTWLTFYFENVAEAGVGPIAPIFRYRADRPLLIQSSLSYFTKPMVADAEGDGTAPRRCCPLQAAGLQPCL